MKDAVQTDYGWCRKGRAGWFWPWQKRSGSTAVGRWGEWVALRHLLGLGWDVVARNWRTRIGEVDIVAYHQQTLVFVEVKTRLSADQEFSPLDNVDEQKLDRVEQLAYDFLQRYELEPDSMRLDLIAIETPDLRRFELRHFIV